MNRIRVARDGHRATLAIHGDFTFDLNREFRDAYRDLPPGTDITVDLSRAGYMDSAGLGMLLQLREHAGGDGARVTITGAGDDIRSVLEVANFQRLFRLE